jgi:hypothetical protein
MAKRIRTSVTIREDDPVPRRRRGKKSNVSVIVIVVLVLLALVWSRQHAGRSGLPQQIGTKH